MHVLLTGHRGFVGRHLHAAMHERGWDVTGIDLVDGVDALDFFRSETIGFDLAVHCAAIVGGRASIDESPLGVATNLALDAWYMRWLVKARVPRAVYFSSSAAYPVHLQAKGWPFTRLHESHIDVDEPERPDATYGWAKLSGELLASYAEAEGCRILIPRPFSGYGEDQDEAYPFPAFAARARRREDPFTVWGDGTSCRDWVHIDDVVGATLALLDTDVTGPVNIGTGRATSFDELAGLMTAAAGYEAELRYEPGAPQGVHTRVCDPSRMLGFYEPKVSLEEGVRRAVSG
ncbi:NAD-dependent epimerase/dehydratase family protein [Streptomyces spinosisporus]|uniref:NAD-dependent epimerase/dehydratase family protein n=1 Tax=Streptomyces spinosisporus TaxID=2927582 RepID=A0ABS9XW29_9ACTN|nr:NAD-dependent epimerase/dehydratase family protein [Streptomyces spinosisporus]MCI3246290.1 NAD-dependent epimerase/dehydratase family protein [Streptomyces spinosisporus]